MRDWARVVRARLSSLRLSPTRETEIVEELSQHLDDRWRELIAGGTSPDEATQLTLAEFRDGDVLARYMAPLRQSHWTDSAPSAAGRALSLEGLTADVRQAARALRASPGFTIISVLSLALGIGASTAIFALVDQVLLRPLPVQRPHELALVRIDGMFNGTTWGDGNEISYPMYVDFRDHNEVFSGMFARFGRTMHVGYAGKPERANGELVSGTYFDVLGVHPARGRLFTPQDDRLPNGHAIAILSYQYWTRRFGRDEAVIGQSLRINGRPYSVVGITEEGFAGMNVGSATQVFVPMMMQADVIPDWRLLDDRRSRFAHVYGRLRPGVSLTQAQASLQPFFRAIRERELAEPYFAGVPEYTKREFLQATIQLTPGAQGISRLRRTLTRPLGILMVIVGGLLLIGCANVAALLVARGTARQREIAIRLALGASRFRIVRQLLVESLLLALIGATAGILLATWGSSLLLGLLVDPETSANVTASPDTRILTFNFGIALSTALLFGLVPAWQAARPALARTLKEQASSVMGGHHVVLRKGLVVVQVALSLLLLVGAGLFVRSITNLLAQDLGFTPTNLVSFSVDGALNGYTGTRAQQFHRTLVERVSALPGVTAAALATQPLLQGFSWQSAMSVEGYAARQDEEVVAHINAVTPGYFEAMQIPILLGRGFTLHDSRSEPLGWGKSPFRVAVANQRFVELYFATRNPIGRHVAIGGRRSAPLPIEIVGVVRNAKYRGMREPVEPQLFLSFFEHPGPDTATVYVRTTHSPDNMFAALRRTVQEIDPGLPLFRMRTMEEQVERSLANERLMAELSATFGLSATLLTVVGLYGLIANAVIQRRREIGIRMALGAVSGEVTWLFLREALGLVVLGCALALPILWALGSYVRSQLYGIEPLDGTTVAVTVIALGAIAAAGSFLPALRGARIQPLTVLREE